MAYYILPTEILEKILSFLSLTDISNLSYLKSTRIISCLPFVCKSLNFSNCCLKNEDIDNLINIICESCEKINFNFLNSLPKYVTKSISRCIKLTDLRLVDSGVKIEDLFKILHNTPKLKNLYYSFMTLSTEDIENSKFKTDNVVSVFKNLEEYQIYLKEIPKNANHSKLLLNHCDSLSKFGFFIEKLPCLERFEDYFPQPKNLTCLRVNCPNFFLVYLSKVKVVPFRNFVSPMSIRSLESPFRNIVSFQAMKISINLDYLVENHKNLEKLQIIKCLINFTRTSIHLKKLKVLNLQSCFFKRPVDPSQPLPHFYGNQLNHLNVINSDFFKPCLVNEAPIRFPEGRLKSLACSLYHLQLSPLKFSSNLPPPGPSYYAAKKRNMTLKTNILHEIVNKFQFLEKIEIKNRENIHPIDFDLSPLYSLHHLTHLHLFNIPDLNCVLINKICSSNNRLSFLFLSNLNSAFLSSFFSSTLPLLPRLKHLCIEGTRMHAKSNLNETMFSSCPLLQTIFLVSEKTNLKSLLNIEKLVSMLKDLTYFKLVGNFPDRKISKNLRPRVEVNFTSYETYSKKPNSPANFSFVASDRLFFPESRLYQALF